MSDPNRFFGSYEGEPPPWDIGRAQPAIERIEAAGRIRGPVIDVGCGTGENALYLASKGHEVLGVDFVPRAIELARAKAQERSLSAQFEVGNALELEKLGRTFASGIDSGVFHVFDDASRALYVQSLGRILQPGALMHILVFSDLEPTEWGGPRRISQQELQEAFKDGWTMRTLERTHFDTRFHEKQGGHAWHAAVERTAAGS